MHRELKINAASVHSNLGGGANGLLGLMLSPGILICIEIKILIELHDTTP